MKTLIAFANAHGLKVARIRYTAHGKTQIGYDLVRPTQEKGVSDIIVQIVPVWYSNGDRWKVVMKTAQSNVGLMWIKSLRGINKIKPEFITHAHRLSSVLVTDEPFLN